MTRAAVLVATVLSVAVTGVPAAQAVPLSEVEPAYLIGACWDPAQPVEQKPATLVYLCDHTSVMREMTWTSWGPDGATGTGIDDAVECQPNCAEGTRLANPIRVHAWNPQPATAAGCPAGVQFYTDFTVAYPEGVPPWVQPGTSWTEDVDYIVLDGMPAVHFKNQHPLSCTPNP
jgi:hypothetical protein